MNICISTSLLQTSLEPSSAQPLLAVGGQKRSGLILCKPHYAEFAGPGAAICNPFRGSYTMILAIGSPEIVEIVTVEERQKAYSRRIQWIHWLNKIVAQADAVQRAEKLLAGFEEFFGDEILSEIPENVLAVLAGVLPPTIADVRSQHPKANGSNLLNSAAPELEIQALGLTSSVSTEPNSVSLFPSKWHTTFNILPCSA